MTCFLFYIECYEEVRVLCLERWGIVYMYRIDSWYRKYYLLNRDLSERLSEDEDDEVEKVVNYEVEKLLWVEKFVFKIYIDFLSDEVSIDICLDLLF